MAKKLAMTGDAEAHDGLHRIVGQQPIGRFLNDPARPHVVSQDLCAGYAAMAADEEREAEAATWCEGLVRDVTDEPHCDGGDDGHPQVAAAATPGAAVG